MSHVLIFTPTYGDALRPETVASVIGQQFDGRVTWEIGRHNPYPAPDERNVGAQFGRGREIFLAGDYDALFLVEHDMVIPPHALAQMMSDPAAVVYAPYMLRHGTNVLSAWRYEGDKNLGMSLTLHPAELKRAKEAGRVRVSGTGFGCTLIRRDVVEKVPFQLGDAAPDVPFAVDCLRAGVPAWARFDVPCGHWHEGVVLRMKGDGGVMVKVVAAQNVTVNVNGESKVLKAGLEYMLPGDEAKELARAGYVHLVEWMADEPAGVLQPAAKAARKSKSK